MTPAAGSTPPRIPGPAHDPLWPRAGDWPPLGHTAADLVLVGVPTHRTSLSGTRADTTPAAIRSALRRYSTFANLAGRGPVDLAELLDIRDAGDLDRPDHGEAEDEAVERIAAVAARAALVVALGGDNAATVPTALGVWGPRRSSAGLITFDAHHDLRDGVSNGSPVRRLVEAGLEPTRTVQIGIADFANSAAYSRRAHELGITVVSRDELLDRPLLDVVAEALEIAGAGGGPIHVDLDVDVCDRSVAPACPASVPGGLFAHELRRACRAVAADARVESIDIVEVDAAADAADGRTVRLAATLVLEAAAGLAARPAMHSVPRS